MKNPFEETGLQKTEHSEALVEVEQQRAIAETQAAMIIAKRFKRNQAEAVDRILVACTRPSLAESALYQYARGGTDITGPSIRLAEAIAQSWGNIQFGIRELEQRNGESTVEAFAWDIETNTKQVKTFQVPHSRYSRAKGNTPLKDPRDIYEAVANQGARRLRACILSIVPGDVVDVAVKQCEATLKTKADVTPERIASLVEMFAKFKVTKAQIEKRIQRRIDAITPALMVNLGKIYNSLKDGMSNAAEWFENAEADETKDLTDKLKQGQSGQKVPETGTPKTGENLGEMDVKTLLKKDAGTLTPEDWEKMTDLKGGYKNLRGTGFPTFVYGNKAHIQCAPLGFYNDIKTKWEGMKSITEPWPLVHDTERPDKPEGQGGSEGVDTTKDPTAQIQAVRDELLQYSDDHIDRAKMECFEAVRDPRTLKEAKDLLIFVKEIFKKETDVDPDGLDNQGREPDDD